MVDHPEEVLSRFVSLAMELTDGVAAGLSLYEEEQDGPGIFRWQHLCGSLAVFEGTTTPRDDSPCGVTLDQARPVLTRHSERGYRWIADAGITLPEVLLVPLFLGGPEPLGTLWVVSDTESHFDSGDARVATELAAFVGIALRLQRGEERLRHALEAQALLLDEMSHRLKNVFAVTNSIIRMGSRSSGTKEEMVQVLSGRLQALASAHALVLPGVGGEAAPKPLELRSLIETILRPHETNGGAARFSMSGPAFTCTPRVVTSLALVVHELATNASKYGSLSAEGGHVDIAWRFDANTLVVCWTESGGPHAQAPARTGFGSTLVKTALAQFRATVDYKWRPGGLVVTISIPLTRLTAQTFRDGTNAN
jgi:two-component sensor histidine kinase